MIAQFAGNDQRTWDEPWPELMLAVNSSVSDSTEYALCFVTQGRDPRMPKALYDKETLGTGASQVTPSENAAKLQEVLVRAGAKKHGARGAGASSALQPEEPEEKSAIQCGQGSTICPKRPKVSRRS